MRIFATREIPLAGVRLLEEAGHEVTQYREKKGLSPDQLIDHCKKHDALFCVGGDNKLDAPFFDACAHLKAISLMSVGFDNVDIAAANRRGVAIGNTPGVLNEATADTAFLLMLAVSRKAFYLSNTIAAGNWGFYEPLANLGISIAGKTLGILGLGRIGLEMARKAKAAFGMHIIYHNRNTNAEVEAELGAEYVSFERLVAESDVLSVHANLSSQTQDMFNLSVFRQMKPTAIFINTARGGIHKEADLTEALQAGLIWGAGLDVTNPEPMRADNPLLQMPNVCVLPHIGSATVEARGAMATLAAQNIIAALQGQRMPNAANPEVYKQRGEA